MNFSNRVHVNELHWALFIGSCVCGRREMLQTAKMKSQNPNEPNKINSNKMSINAHVSPDPQMHGFLFA